MTSSAKWVAATPVVRVELHGRPDDVVIAVHADTHPRYHALLSAFQKKTGCPVVVNTSFNVRGEPIVCTPEHAFRCFMATNMDALVLEDFILLKEEQGDAASAKREEYLAQFQLD